MTWTTLAALTLIAIQVVQSPPPPLSPPVVSWERLQVLRHWVAAVEQHTPVALDAPVSSVRAWSRGDIVNAWLDVQMLAALVKNPRANRFFLQPPGQMMSFLRFVTQEDIAALEELAAGIRARPFPEVFLKRAALLHSDLAMSLAEAEPSAAWSSMLVPNNVVVRSEDGQQVSLNGGVVHWEFGRVLLDAVREPGRDPFVRSWYRATLAYKLDIDQLDSPHFEHAVRVLPDDSVVHFQMGCLIEGFAEPRAQVLAQSMRLPAGKALVIRPATDELRAAEREFRRALVLEPTHAEARLHLGRTLGRLGWHKEAAAELRVAAAEVREPLLTYYAQLFLGA